MQLLHLCLEVEETLGRIYRHFADHGPGDQALRQLWRELAQDEEQHALQLRLLLRLPQDGLVASPTLPLDTVRAMRDYARKALQEITSKPVSEATALKLARKLERDFNRVHAEAAVEYPQENTRAMFAALAQADEGHARLLEEYGRGSGV